MYRLVACLLLGALTSGLRKKPSKHVAGQQLLSGQHGKDDEDVRKALERLLQPDNLKASTQTPSILEEVPTCYLSQSDCLIEDMTEGTLVYTDQDDSRCWNGDPFAFVVRPGRPDKLYWYFPGGGACFEIPGPWPGVVTFCYQSMDEALGALGYGGGAHDFDNPDNVFHDYTFISAPYCSGGGHIANSTFTTLWETYYQYGYNNNEYLRRWALNQVNRGIDENLKSFVVMGSSAGSMGAALWADTLLSTFTYEKASVIFDSYMGVFPGGSLGLLMRQLGACPLPIVTPFREDCENGDGNLVDVIDRLIGKYPNVAFASIQSKVDAIQIVFYTLIGHYFWGDFTPINQTDFYNSSNYMMGVYNKYPNYATYIVNGDFHVFPVFPVEWYSTSTLGPNTTAPSGTPMLYEWISGVVNHEGMSSQCDGERAPNGAQTLDYCDETLFPKQLSV